MLLATLSPGKTGSSGRSRTGIVFFTKEVHFWFCHGGMKLVLPRGLAPRSFAFARRHARLLHLGSLKTFASCRCCPGPSGLEDRHARCYINDAGMVAEFGIAPNSPRLQRGANLSQLFSLKLVPPRGNAPRSIDYQSMALLLSYGGEKSPVKVVLPRLSDVSRARCYYANGRKVVTASGLSPDRTGLRTQVLEMLCICGGTAYGSRRYRKWRSTRESHSGRF